MIQEQTFKTAAEIPGKTVLLTGDIAGLYLSILNTEENFPEISAGDIDKTAGFVLNGICLSLVLSFINKYKESPLDKVFYSLRL